MKPSKEMERALWGEDFEERRKRNQERIEELKREEKRAIRWVIAVGVVAILFKGGVLFAVGYVVYLLLKHFGVI